MESLIRCKLYHKTTWFETIFYFAYIPIWDVVANYITKLRGLKLNTERMNYEKELELQIISQNYVVWNLKTRLELKNSIRLQIISQNYVVWNFLTSMLVLWFIPLQIISQNYVVWNTPWLNALAKGLKLQIISQNYVVWNFWAFD